ncbi:MAG: ABC transporter ATP-binding protein [Gemmatimonadetes bacterium]|nr:ABC transporter ATP-binding protein [Gemmatimonadota bacterium]
MTDRAPAGGAPLFEARGLGKTYGSGPTAVVALHDVSLTLATGEFVVILGPSGSGKSTLLNILGGLDAPSAGYVRFRDHVLTGAGERALTAYRREHVGFVFQFYNLIPSLTAEENVALVTGLAGDSPHRRGGSPRDAGAVRDAGPLPAVDALRLVGLEARAHAFPAELSGGEQQRVAIARAVAKDPDVLLCDEPTGALDCETGKLVLAALRRANRERGTTTVVITHNAGIAAMADRTLRMRGGAIVEDVRNPAPVDPQTLSW